MPTPPFPIMAYCGDPATPATIDVRMVKGVWPAGAEPLAPAAFAEADYESYQRQVITDWDVRTATAKYGRLRSKQLIFAMRGPGNPQNVIGWIVVGTFGGVEYLLAREKHDGPFPMLAEGNGLGVVVDLPILVQSFS